MVIRALCSALAVLSSTLFAAAQAPKPDGAKTDAPKADAKKELPYEELTLETPDNVELFINYYKFKPVAGDDKRKDAKEAPVVLILHHDKGNKQDYDALARDLQNAGNVVIVPDLRGFGKSNKRLVRTVTGGQAKVTRTTPVASTRLIDFEVIVDKDLEQIKTMMLDLHRNKECDIRRLCVVGVEMGAVLAVNWSLLKDWNWVDLTTGPQGKDVRGLVLISPRWNFKGMIINAAVEKGDFIQFIPTMIMNGSKDPAYNNDAKRLHDQFERYLPKVPEDATVEDKRAKQQLFYFPYETTLQGYKLLLDPGLKPPPAGAIRSFIDARVFGNEFNWAERK